MGFRVTGALRSGTRPPASIGCSRKSEARRSSDRAPIWRPGLSSTGSGTDTGRVMARFPAALAERAASLLVVLAAWEAAAWVAHSRLFPGAGAVLTTLVDEAVRGDLLHHLGATLARVTIAFT